jgi:photosystem II stability/assembly factor-like uncharacterized protein
MKLFLSTLTAIVLLYSCSSQKEITKPKEEEKPAAAVEKKKTFSFTYEMQKSKTNSSLRGISVIDSLNAWASGSNGIYLRTTDGGKNWTEGKVKGFETLDFRDVEAFDKNNAIIMSVDAPAFFFKTTDGGKSWKRRYMNRDAKIFFDGIAFWDDKNGIAFSDPIDGKFFIVSTKNGGDTWKEFPSLYMPSALNGEGGFAASGTSVAVSGKDLAWIGAGGAERTRIFLSQDGGENWRAIYTPLKNGTSSCGVFSLCFKDDLYGVAVGGDYKNDKDKSSNCAISDDGGLSWQLVDKNQPNGFRSSVAWNGTYKFYLTTGTSGSDYSVDDGKTWMPINTQSFNGIGISKSDGSCFVVGDKGAIARVRVK